MTQWRSFDGRQNPVIPNAHVNFELQHHPNESLIRLWDYRKTDSRGIAEFIYRSPLIEGTYKVISSYWDSIEATSFNSGFIAFSLSLSAGGGYVWKLKGFICLLNYMCQFVC